VLEPVQHFLLRLLQEEDGRGQGTESLELGEFFPGETRRVSAGQVRVPVRLENATLIVEGDLLCEGDVYNAQVVASGSIQIQGWCSHTLVVGLGDVELHSAIYSQIFARGQLRIRREARFSSLQAAQVEASEAVFFGGQVVAAESIRVRQLRWAFGEHASALSIGMPYLQRLEHQYWRAELRRLRDRMQAVQQELEAILQQRHRQVSEHIRHLQQEYHELYARLQEVEQRSYGSGHHRASIEVWENVPADTIVAIHGIVYRVPTELLAVRFRSDGMRIVLESLSDEASPQGE